MREDDEMTRGMSAWQPLVLNVRHCDASLTRGAATTKGGRRVRESLHLLERMPWARLFGPAMTRWAASEGGERAVLAEAQTRRAAVREAVRAGRVDLYTAGPGPDYTYNVWDYPRWWRFEVWQWLELELRREEAGE